MQSAFVLAIYYHLLETVLRKIHRETVEEGDCLMWPGANDNGSPVMAMPYRRIGQARPAGDRPPQQIRVRTLLLELFTGKRPPANTTTPRSIVVSTRCGNGACVCPDCAGYMQRGTVIARGLAGMDQATATLRRKRIAETRRSTRVLTDQQAARIKTELSTTARALARELGVNFSVVNNCRAGRTYRDFSASPWQGLA